MSHVHSLNLILVPTCSDLCPQASSVPPNTLMLLHPNTGTYELNFNLRTLYSKEIPGGSTNAGSSCLSRAPLLPLCKELSKRITVPNHKWSFGHARPKNGLQSASVSREAMWVLSKAPRHSSSSVSLSWKVKLITQITKSFLFKLTRLYKNNLWYKKISTLCRRICQVI